MDIFLKGTRRALFFTSVRLVPDDPFQGDGRAGIQGPQALGLGHGAHLGPHARVDLKRQRKTF